MAQDLAGYSLGQADLLSAPWQEESFGNAEAAGKVLSMVQKKWHKI